MYEYVIFIIDMFLGVVIVRLEKIKNKNKISYELCCVIGVVEELNLRLSGFFGF